MSGRGQQSRPPDLRSDGSHQSVFLWNVPSSNTKSRSVRAIFLFGFQLPKRKSRFRLYEIDQAPDAQESFQFFSLLWSDRVAAIAFREPVHPGHRFFWELPFKTGTRGVRLKRCTLRRDHFSKDIEFSYCVLAHSQILTWETHRVNVFLHNVNIAASESGDSNAQALLIQIQVNF